MKHTQRKSSDQIGLPLANRIAESHGQWIWDGLIYNRNGIVDVQLTILPNAKGAKLRRILRECYNLLQY